MIVHTSESVIRHIYQFLNKFKSQKNHVKYFNSNISKIPGSSIKIFFYISLNLSHATHYTIHERKKST